MIKAVIFDCFGVLSADMWREFAGSLDDATYEIAHELNRQRDAGLLDEDEFLTQLSEAVNVSRPDLAIRLKNNVNKNTRLLNFIKELREQHLKIGLLSNVSNNWVRDTFLTTAEQDLFDDMVLSYEVSIIKPDPRIFMLACERLRIGPHEAIFVDDIDSNCRAAEAEGLFAVQYQNFEQAKSEILSKLHHK